MRHRVSGRKLGRTTSHRWALFSNMAASLVEHERIETTLFRAKEMRSFADHLITLGKQQTLAARREAYDFLRSHRLVSKLFAILAPRFAERKGGYTRLMKLGFRLGDAAPMAVLEYLPGPTTGVVPEKKPKKKEAVNKPKKPSSKIQEKPKKKIQEEAREKPKEKPKEKTHEEKKKGVFRWFRRKDK